MKEADFRVNDCKFSSYLNIYSGLSAYEILREQGMSEQESIVIYDYEVLKKHTKFERYSTIGEGGECCHDAFKRIK